MPEAVPSKVAPLVFQAALRSEGAVKKFGPPIDLATAVELRKAGHDLVVCGPRLVDNIRLAQQIEAAATGNRCTRHPPHEELAGRLALSHFQPNPRPPAGHTFYEDPPRRTAR